MRRKSALLITLLCCLAAVGTFAVVGASQTTGETNPVVVSVNDSANYLAVPDGDVTRQETAESGLSLGTAIESDASSIQSDVVRANFDQSFHGAANDSAKTDALKNVAERAEKRRVTLERRNQEAIREYADGSMSAAEFSRERARVAREAQAYHAIIERAERVANADPGYSLPSTLEQRLANVRGELEVLQGPVSDTSAQAVHGERAGQPVYVEASNSGYTMAYVADDQYFRETYLGDERQPSLPDKFAQSDDPRGVEAQLRGYELYPWLVNNSVSPNLYGFGTSGIYRISTGDLQAYIDGGTTNAFRESQRQQVAAMPVSNAVTETNDSVRLQLNRTYQTGPLEVSLRDNQTGEPVEGTVVVDGRNAGSTGSDGRLWTVEPRGQTRVTATAENGQNVSAVLPA